MTTDTVGGVWTYSLELVDALAPHGVEVVLAAMGAPLRPDQKEELTASAVAHHAAAVVKLEWMDDPWEHVRNAGGWLLDLAREHEPDVVHLNGYAHAALSWGRPTLVVGHSCVLSWFRAVERRPAPPEWKRYEEAVRAGLAGADLLVAPTRAMLDELVELYAPTCERGVIPNGRRQLAAAVAKEPYVFSAGRLWDGAKNVAALDRVAGAVPWPVLVAGEGAPAGGGARALGRLASFEVADHLARAAVYAAPARYEPFGLGILEAARAGCALVLGDIPSLREVWGDDALFVDPWDDEALAAALRAVIADDARRASLAAGARRRALTYTPERMAAGYVAAYERLLARDAVEAVV